MCTTKYRRYRQTQKGSLKKTITKLAAEQSMTQAIMQAVIKVTKVAIMAVREAENLVNNTRPVHTVPRSGSPVLK